jgi:Uma2 family endonuclease
MSPALKRLAAIDYLALDRAAATRSEFFFGEVVAMAGGTANHSLIASNIVGEAWNSLKGRPCRVLSSDMRTKAATGVYTYPDVLIICGKPQFDDDREDVLLNPLVIFEVLSPSTESYDRGTKFTHYRSIPSLMTYVLVAQDQAYVECYARDSRGWILTDAKGLEHSIEIPGADITLPLSEIYSQVEFPPVEGVG